MFIGREREISDLNGFWGRDHGVLMTCRGRRGWADTIRILRGISKRPGTDIYTGIAILLSSCVVVSRPGLLKTS